MLDSEANDFVLKAVRTGDIAMLRTLEQRGADFNQAAPILYAIQYQHREVVAWLLDPRYGRTKLSDPRNFEVLAAALSSDDQDLMQQVLLQDMTMTIDSLHQMYFVALRVVVKTDNTSLMEYLLAQHYMPALLGRLQHPCIQHGFDLLLLSVTRKHIASFNTLLKYITLSSHEANRIIELSTSIMVPVFLEFLNRRLEFVDESFTPSHRCLQLLFIQCMPTDIPILAQRADLRPLLPLHFEALLLKPTWTEYMEALISIVNLDDFACEIAMQAVRCHSLHIFKMITKLCRLPDMSYQLLILECIHTIDCEILHYIIQTNLSVSNIDFIIWYTGYGADDRLRWNTSLTLAKNRKIELDEINRIRDADD
jgi:hypothetical protein